MGFISFPKGFLWGTSTAAHQIEGGNCYSDWWEFEQNGMTEKSLNACDSYNRYEEDFEILTKMGQNAHRLSIEWARIFPNESEINTTEIEHYRKVLISLKDKKITTFVTLFHFTLPQWFAKKGGFSKKENLHYFEKFARVCYDEFKDVIDYWVILNEPTTYILKGYLIGIWPPQKRNLWTAVKVFLNIAKVHNLIYKSLKSKDMNLKIGSAHQYINYLPEKTGFDILLAKIANYIANDLFYVLTKGHHDYIGLNYYFQNYISLKHLLASKIINNIDIYEQILQDAKTVQGWTMQPEGILDAIRRAYSLIKAPVFITEHGISDPTDSKRIHYIKQALVQLSKAIEEGIPVNGYLHWSLIDNFEWNLGFKSKFGLTAVDNITQDRIIKESAVEFTKICRQNGVEI